jgi:hypothetical protein
MSEFIETYHLDALALGVLVTFMVAAGFWLHQLITQMIREPERMRAAQGWATSKIEEHLFDSYAQLDAMLRMLDTEDEAPLISLVDDVKARLNRADLVVLAMRDGRIASHIDPDGKRVFEIRKERAL